MIPDSLRFLLSLHKQKLNSFCVSSVAVKIFLSFKTINFDLVTLLSTLRV